MAKIPLLLSQEFSSVDKKRRDESRRRRQECLHCYVLKSLRTATIFKLPCHGVH